MAFTLQDLGENIRDLRKSRISKLKPDKPMMQKELAERSGIPASSLCNIENGKYKNPTWEILNKIALGLDCDVSDFFISIQAEVSPSRIALNEMIEMIIKERLDSILKDEQIK
ncbi:MAG: helix-turn-helix domain-containing protein [Candidatus Aminicenantes bacterium]|nr:helix-turn-helix domain-containing protein [Candidatus Aminicenantes bacterium]